VGTSVLAPHCESKLPGLEGIINRFTKDRQLASVTDRFFIVGSLNQEAEISCSFNGSVRAPYDILRCGW
jgi:hypothetical protein